MGKNKKRNRDVDVDIIASKVAATAKGSNGSDKRTSSVKATTKAIVVIPDSIPSTSDINPLWHQQKAFLRLLTETERSAFFNDEACDPTRRAEIWMQQADLGEQMINQYAWATPDTRSLRVLAHFSPLIEIGCGSNAYWCRQMIQTTTAAGASIDVVGYDTSPTTGGTILGTKSDKKTLSGNKSEFRVRQGGPEVLSDPRHSKRTLFLCYPDENDQIDESTGEPVSLAAACLEQYQGDYVVHVGELAVTSPTLSLDQAPWGRSSSPEFQEGLMTHFHCVLSVSLPNWLHTADCLTVWKRSSTTTIVFEADDNEEEDEAEEVEFRHIPLEERLPVDVAAPCLQHLLEDPPARNVGNTNQSNKNGKQDESSSVKIKKSKKGTSTPKNETEEPSEYECPW